MTDKKLHNKYYAMCPQCGTELFKGIRADGIEILCRRCKSKYEIRMTETELMLRELKVAYNN